jgi:hypothetical protein
MALMLYLPDRIRIGYSSVEEIPDVFRVHVETHRKLEYGKLIKRYERKSSDSKNRIERLERELNGAKDERDGIETSLKRIREGKPVIEPGSKRVKSQTY